MHVYFLSRLRFTGKLKFQRRQDLVGQLYELFAPSKDQVQITAGKTGSKRQ